MPKPTNKKYSIKEILPKQKTLTKKTKKHIDHSSEYVSDQSKSLSSEVLNLLQNKKSKHSSQKIKKQDSTISNIRQKKSSYSFSSSHSTIKSVVKNMTNTKNNNCDTPYQLPSEKKYGQSTHTNKVFETINNQNLERLKKDLANKNAIKPTVLNKRPIICSLEGGIVKTGKSGCPCCPF